MPSKGTHLIPIFFQCKGAAITADPPHSIFNSTSGRVVVNSTGGELDVQAVPVASSSIGNNLPRDANFIATITLGTLVVSDPGYLLGRGIE